MRSSRLCTHFCCKFTNTLNRLKLFSKAHTYMEKRLFNFLMLICVTLAVPVPHNRCLESTISEKEAMLAKYRGQDHLSLVLPPEVRRMVSKNQVIPADSTNCTRGPDQMLYGNSTCPEKIESSAIAMMDRSTCPYYYVLTNDPARYPSVIAEARCRCPACLDNSKGISENLCEPLYFTTIVLRRTDCENGVYKYVPNSYNRQVGCSCVKRRFTESTSSSGPDRRQQTNQVPSPHASTTKKQQPAQSLPSTTPYHVAGSSSMNQPSTEPDYF